MHAQEIVYFPEKGWYLHKSDGQLKNLQQKVVTDVGLPSRRIFNGTCVQYKKGILKNKSQREELIGK